MGQVIGQLMERLIPIDQGSLKVFVVNAMF